MFLSFPKDSSSHGGARQGKARVTWVGIWGGGVSTAKHGNPKPLYTCPLITCRHPQAPGHCSEVYVVIDPCCDTCSSYFPSTCSFSASSRYASFFSLLYLSFSFSPQTIFASAILLLPLSFYFFSLFYFFSFFSSSSFTPSDFFPQPFLRFSLSFAFSHLIYSLFNLFTLSYLPFIHSFSGPLPIFFFLSNSLLLHLSFHC